MAGELRLISRSKLVQNIDYGNRMFGVFKKTYENASTTAYSRFRILLDLHEKRFPGDKLVFLLRAPGRVNIIGEHVDYCGLPCLPCALEDDCMVLGSPRQDNIVSVSNADEPYGDRQFELSLGIAPFETGDWGNYVKSGALGVVKECGHTGDLCGFDALYSCSVPAGSGLSSSSAIVVASAMAVLASSRVSLPPVRLAEIMAEAEWFVGTRGGGMDHAACILAQAGKALRVDFFPLRARPVELPARNSLVVFGSGVVASKTKEALVEYNARPASCSVACAIMCRHSGQHAARLGDIYFKLGYDGAMRLLAESVSETAYSVPDVAAALGLIESAVIERFFSRSGSPLVPSEPLPLFKRARHVFTEARRVELCCADGTTAAELGAHMNAGMKSLRDDYEVSHERLDALCSAAQRAGALGSRLTGAGFGGCTVSLVPDALVAHVISEVRMQCGASTFALPVRPSSGARVLIWG